MQTCTNPILTEFELFWIICYKSWTESVCCELRVTRRGAEKTKRLPARQSHMVQEWHFLCHIWLPSCCLMTLLSFWHTEESWFQRATVLLSQGNIWHTRISLFGKSWLLLRCLLLARFFKQHKWRERKIRNILFCSLNFTTLCNTDKPSLSL